jgi:hypothetical protein
MTNEQQDSNLVDLYNKAIREDSKESRDELLAHWKVLCELLDGVQTQSL